MNVFPCEVFGFIQPDKSSASYAGEKSEPFLVRFWDIGLFVGLVWSNGNLLGWSLKVWPNLLSFEACVPGYNCQVEINTLSLCTSQMLSN